eukprot:970079_1
MDVKESMIIVCPVFGIERVDCWMYQSGGKVRYNRENMTYESNFGIIAGNVDGRTVSDSGHFTQCIVKSFEANLNRIVKWSWDALIKEIRRNLERETNHSELVTVEENICYDAIRFEKGVRIKGNEETLFEAQPNVGNYAKVIKEEVEMTIKATLVESQ